MGAVSTIILIINAQDFEIENDLHPQPSIPECVCVEVAPLVDLVARLEVVGGRVELGGLVGVFTAEVAHQRHSLLVDHAVDDEEGEGAGGAVLEDLGIGVVLALSRRHVMIRKKFLRKSFV